MTPVAPANARITSVDNAGTAASDDTVDTDGKGLIFTLEPATDGR